MHDEKQIVVVLNKFNIQFKKFCPKINIQGSPERTLFRTVIEDTDNRLFVIEHIPKETYNTKLNIAKTLEFLKSMPEVQPYLKDNNDDFITKADERFWMVIPYIKGIELPRPGFINDGWRGKVLADFLIRFKENTKDIPFFSKDDAFSVKKYVYESMKRFENNPKLTEKLKPIVNYLEKEFMQAHDTLPIAFCHGDYHPTNIIWGKDKINSVIDWEFTGYKPEIYDIANMISCVGFENPIAYKKGLIPKFINSIKQSGLISPVSWRYLKEYIIALRFGWLREWLHKKDTEMIKLELTYMRLLKENALHF